MEISCSHAPTGTAFDSSWDNLGPWLEELDLDGAQLPYQLPASWGQAWKGVKFISIARAGLVSTLPREWGVDGAFPILKRIWLYNNPNLTGEAPTMPLLLAKEMVLWVTACSCSSMRQGGSFGSLPTHHPHWLY